LWCQYVVLISKMFKNRFCGIVLVRLTCITHPGIWRQSNALHVNSHDILCVTSDIPCISPVIYPAYHQWYTLCHQWYTLHITNDIPCISPMIYPAYNQWYTDIPYISPV
jgi:hypothetical protein